MKNGFTLIELIAVIVILAIVAIITTPVVLNTVETSKTKLNETQKLAIENAAREWVLKNLSINNNKAVNSSNTEVKYITIKNLQDAHYLDNKASLEKIKISNLTKAGVCIKVKVNSDNEFVGFSYQYEDDVENNCS